MPAGRRLLFVLLFAGLALPLGCGNRARQEVLETELRTRDVQLRELVSELGKSEFRAESLRQEVEVLRKGVRISPEQAGAVFGLRRIILGRGTGGVDDDAMPGDEALAVFIEPRDSDDHIIKVPGSRLHLMILEINFQGLKTPLCAWDFTPEQLRQTWKEGLLSTGYYLKLPWKVFPRTENLRIVARLILPDDRLFEADKDIRVRLVPGKSLSTHEMPPPPNPVPPGPEMLPFPGVVPPPEPLPKKEKEPELGPPPGVLPRPILPPPPEPKAGAEEPARWQPSDRNKGPVLQPVRWEPAPLIGVIKLGRPVVHEPPPLP